jgi:hypothetical protein
MSDVRQGGRYAAGEQKQRAPQSGQSMELSKTRVVSALLGTADTCEPGMRSRGTGALIGGVATPALRMDRMAERYRGTTVRHDQVKTQEADSRAARVLGSRQAASSLGYATSPEVCSSVVDFNSPAARSVGRQSVAVAVAVAVAVRACQA